MAIVESNLVQGYILQNYFVSKDTGEALSAGVVTLYKDNDRQILKNWYYLDGTFGAYEFKKLPNPLVLSAIGTIVDDNGNNVIPFYYPFDEENASDSEAYYITVDDSEGQRQFTVQNFPFSTQQRQESEVPTYQNLIVNGRFWNNISQTYPTGGGETIQATNDLDLVVCPSQHDGFHQPDIRFQKDIPGGDDQITFKKFSFGADEFKSAIRPEIYLNHLCNTSLDSDVKWYQIPISLHLRTLDNVDATFTIWSREASTNVNNSFTVKLVRFYGTDPGTSKETTIGTVDTMSTNWTRSVFSFKFPSTINIPESLTGDSAYYIRIELPSALDFDIDLAIPSVYLGDEVPTTDFVTYDQIDPVINSPRTGDFRQTLNTVNLGWIAANNKTIGSPNSAADIRGFRTWPLYKLLWDHVLQLWAPIDANPVAVRGTSAKEDYTNNRVLQLTQNLGRVLAGLNPDFTSSVNFTVSVTPVTVTVTGTPTKTIALGSSTSFVAGDPIQFSTTVTLPSPLIPNFTYYVSSAGLSGTTIEVAITRADAVSGVNSVSLTSTGSGTHSIVNTDYDLTLSSATTLKAGTPVNLTTAGTLPAGFIAGKVYYVSSASLSTTNIRLAVGLEDALNGYYLPILDAGSGTFSVRSALGAYYGTNEHVLSIGELAAHKHDITSPSGNLLYTTGSSVPGGGGASNTIIWASPETDDTGDSLPHNITQPTSFTNVFIKL